ncbi:MAG: alkaline phosphatase family protein, partial [Algicola sp.]|nr:alkaline phosphatase family protein [Algicola sp.]
MIGASQQAAVNNESEDKKFPLILAGPVLRKTTIDEVNLWLVTSQAVRFEPCFSLDVNLNGRLKLTTQQQVIRVSDSLHIHLLTCKPQDPLAKDQLIYYDIASHVSTGDRYDSLKQLIPDIVYPGQSALSFFIPEQISSLFFGSCRNYHHPSKDTLVVADNYIGSTLNDVVKRPCVLLHGGDQVYLDDVGGPTLNAIHKMVELFDLVDECLPDEKVTHTDHLYNNSTLFYNRQSILPKVSFDSSRLFFRLMPIRKTQNVFSTVKGENHLISLGEVIGLYMLAWSPECWKLTERETNNLPPGLNRAHKVKFEQELMAVRDFIEGLGQVRRMMAHIPNYMIFDDHDVTDDWNLTAQWEQNVYSNPLSKRVISNALLGYWIFQGWGNTPERFDKGFVDLVEQVTSKSETDKVEQLEQMLYDFSHWHYVVDLEPDIVVLDTRTHRWRSERSQKNPSGLLDWERLVELETILVNKEASIIVSPAPIFGVKLIETIQRVFSFFGQELMVDAENWM